MESNHESVVAPNPSQAASAASAPSASAQPGLLPARDPSPPVEQQQPASPRLINRRLTFDSEQHREESPGQQSPLSPSTPPAISDLLEGGASFADGPVAAESSPHQEDRECSSPSPQPSPPPSPGYWEDRRCCQLEKENRRFRIDLLTAQAELRQTQVDLVDAEAEVSELFDQYRHWKDYAEKLQQNFDRHVGCVLVGLRPDLYAGYEKGKAVTVLDLKQREKQYEIERKVDEFKRKRVERQTRGIRKTRGV
jgi:hypothetical protein